MGKCGLGYIRLNCSSILMYCFFSRNSIFKLSGGRLRPGESDIEGLKRKLASKLSV
ncbi:unnamed protein product [Brassica rapa subsp. trilocularis]|uniref:(rape) hypothetical protein n=1 Tax=Brassica napus TaxID=3708 RepID=A0A816STL8_BRANA|nr:unnamed protein product [Brassica napus]